MRDNEKRTLNCRLYEDSWLPFARKADVIDTIKEDYDFYKGNQWLTENKDNEPRVTVNIVNQIVNNNASKIAGAPCHLSFASSDEDFDCIALKRFDDSVLKTIDHDVFSYNAYKNAYITGTEITYVNWDAEHETYGGFFSGGINETHIDPLHIAVENPRQPDIQKQEWVMTFLEISLSKAIAMVKEQEWPDEDEKIKALIDEASPSHSSRGVWDGDETDKNAKTVRLFTRFFRIDGEVFYDNQTKYVRITKYPMPLSTDLADTIGKDYASKLEKAEKEGKDCYQIVRDYEIDFEDTVAEFNRKRNSLAKHRKMKAKFSLYPFATFAPKPIDNFFFGLSTVKNVMSMQQAVNYDISNTVKIIENTAYQLYFVKDDALQGQTITGEPGQWVVDYHRGAGNGVYRLESQPMTGGVTEHAGTLMKIAKDISNSSDVSMGQVQGSDVSGYQYALQIKQANSPLEQEQRIAWKYQKDLARIRLMFYQHYLSEANYVTELSRGQQMSEEENRKALFVSASSPMYGQEGFRGNLYMPDGKTLIPSRMLLERFKKPTSRMRKQTFDGEKIWGLDFDVIIEAKQGLIDSQASEQQTLDNMILNGGIANLTPDKMKLYIMASSSISDATKEELMYYIEQINRSEITKLTQQNQALQEQLLKLQQALGLSEKYNAELSSQFKQSMKSANRVNALAMQENTRLKQMASQANPINSSGNEMTAQQIAAGQQKSDNASGA